MLLTAGTTYVEVNALLAQCLTLHDCLMLGWQHGTKVGLFFIVFWYLIHIDEFVMYGYIITDLFEGTLHGIFIALYLLRKCMLVRANVNDLLCVCLES